MPLIAPPVVSPPAARLAPMLPPGANERFSRAVQAVAARTAARDWKGAAVRLAALPARRVTVAWDPAGLPSADRAAFLAEANAGLRAFAPAGKYDVAIVPAGRPAAMTISFVPSLPSVPLGGPGGSTLVERRDGGLDLVIGLRRGSRRGAVTPVDLHNAAARGIGTYFGLRSAPFPDSPVFDSPEPIGRPLAVPVRELVAVRRNLQIVDSLRAAVAKRVVLIPAPADALVQPAETEKGEVAEGARAEFLIQIANRGVGPLAFRTEGDCGCIADTGEGVVPPGGVALIRPVVDTTGYDGPISKRFVVVTNDPKVGSVPFVLKAVVRPVASWTGTQSFVLPNTGGAEGETTLRLFGGMKATGVRLEGAPGEVSLRPDGDGYIIPVKLTGERLAQGRSLANLVVSTDSPERPLIRRAIYLQRGIVTLPGEVFLGIMTPEDKTAVVTLSRPGRPFRITAITGLGSRLSVPVPAASLDEHRLTLKVKGGSKGDVEETLVIKTDDPDNPEIRVRVRGLGG